MRKTLFALAAITGLATVSIAGAAAAEPYKWCAEYSGAMGGANCGFVTEQQCMANIVGTGGFCRPNSFYGGESEKRTISERKRNPG